MNFEKLWQIIGRVKLPWRIKHVGVARYLLLRPLVKLKIRYELARRGIRLEADTVSVVMAVKNRSDHRISNALLSIRNQEYNQHLIELVVVDYDSAPEQAVKLRKLCAKQSARYIRCEQKPLWNKAHALNIGIKQARGKYTLSTDADIVFEPHYLRVAVDELRNKPFQVILATFLDLPEEAKREIDFAHWKKAGAQRRSNSSGKGINMGYTHFYHWIRGYDERYSGWGREDADLVRRLIAIGLTTKDIGDRAMYFHQWHPRHEGVGKHFSEEHIVQNRHYFKQTRSIRRNPVGWGECDVVTGQD